MHYGFRIVEDMIDGLSQYMDAHGFRTIEDFRGRAVPNVQDWGDLDLNYKIIADIHPELASAASCATSLARTARTRPSRPTPSRKRQTQWQSVHVTEKNGKKNPNWHGRHVPRIIEEECVGCNLCALVCPVESSVTMKHVDTGAPFEELEWQRLR